MKTLRILSLSRMALGVSVSVLIGVQANAPENIGRSAVLSSVGIQGAFVTPVAENFAAPLNTNAWDVIAAYPPSIQVAPPNATWLSWTSTNNLDLLETNSNLRNAGGWSTTYEVSPHQPMIWVPGELGVT